MIILKQNLWLLLLMALPLSAQDIQLSLPDTNGVRGEFITIPVRVQPSLTGLNVTSYQLRIQFDENILTVNSVLSSGTLTGSAGMTIYTNSPQPNIVTIAAAGNNPLQGEGDLIRLSFRIRRSGYSDLRFADSRYNVLNEGSPTVFLDDGSFYSAEPPTITIYPDQDILAIGEQLQFYVYNATDPVLWQVTNPTLAAIDEQGTLTALKKGKVQVIATDAVGLKDSTNGFIDIRPIKLSIRDTTVTVNQTIELPIYASMLSTSGIYSGTLALAFDGNILTPQSLIKTGALLETWSNVTLNTSIPGKATIAFAGTSSLSGSGELCRIQFIVKQSGWTMLEFSNVIFNESLLAKTVNGALYAQTQEVLYLDPSEGGMIVSETLQLNVTNGTPPYTWEVTDPTVASIDNDGLLTANKSGIVRVVVSDAADASGMSGIIRISNVRLAIADAYATAGSIIDVPVEIDQFNDGAAISAFQAIIDFDSSALKAVTIVSAGTLSAGWSLNQVNFGNRLSIAAAGATGFYTTGTLFSIRFQVNNALPEGYYSVISYNRILLNEGDPSVLAIPGSVLIVATPAEPYLIAPDDGAENLPPDIEFSWYESAQAETYNLQISNDYSFSELSFQDSLITGTTRLVDGLSDGWYYWRVSASNTAGTSVWSSVRSFSVNTQVINPPAEPTLISPEDGAFNLPVDVEFSWGTSQGADSYCLEIATDNSFTSLIYQDAQITVTTHLVTGFGEGLYFWRVSATNTAGTGAWSSVQSFSIGTQGFNESSALFDGFQDRIRILDASPINPAANPSAYQITGTSITVEAWIYLTALPTNSDAFVIACRPYSSGEPFRSYDLRIDNYWSEDDDPRIQWIISDGNIPGNWGATLSPANPLVGSWLHVAGTYDGSKVRLYVNGELVDESSFSADIGTGETGFYIGGITNSYFEGLIDEVRLWNVVRSQVEIQATLNQTLLGSEAGLVGYWPMETTYLSGDLVVTPDQTANHNDLIVQYDAHLVPFPAGSVFQIAPTTINIVDDGHALSNTAYHTQLRANGWPVPTITVDQMPDGMIREEDSLFWIPSGEQFGFFTVTATASNTAGSVTGEMGILVEKFQRASNQIQVDVTHRGKLGAWGKFGKGVIYNAKNGLYTGDFSLVDRDDAKFAGGIYTNGFEPLQDFSDVASLFTGFTAFKTAYGDAMESDRINVKVEQTVHTRPDDKFSILEYKIINQSGGILDDLFTQLTADFDVGTATNDLGGFDSTLALTYTYEDDGVNNHYYYGFQLLSHPVAGQAIWYSGIDDQYVRSTLNLTTKSSALGLRGDLRNQINAGPFRITTNDSLSVFYAILAADNLNDLMMAATTVKTIFAGTDIKDRRQFVLPANFALYKNYPNPFNPTTTIRYDIPKATHVTLTIYNMAGQIVEQLVNQKQQPGFYSVFWDASRYSSGIYIYRITTGEFQQVKKCILIK